MEKHTISIKGMVCNRCMMTVKNELKSLGHRSVSVSLGAVSFISSTALHTQDALEKRLSLLGFNTLSTN